MGRPRQQRAPRQHYGKAGRKNGGRFGSKNVRVTSTEEFDDDIDKFHKGADKMPLDVNKDLELSEDDMEEPVFDLQAGSGSEEDDDEGSDEDDLDEEQLSGLAAKMAKQAKILRQKTSLLEEEEEDEAEEDQEGRNEKKAAWGKRKKMYYDADNVDYELYSSDEEAPAEEEAEALRLQRLIAEKLRPEDFDLDDDEEEDGARSLDENERTLEEVVKKSEAKGSEEAKNILSNRGHIGGSTKDSNILVEEVEKDVSALSKEEQMNVIMSDAPELVGLLAELREGLDELDNKIEPLLVKVKGCSRANKGGLRFLETKRMLLLCYSQSILFYLLMKAEGRSVRDHPVIARLVEIRTFLQKLQPVEKKLQNQMDKLLTSPIDYSPASNIEAHDDSKPSIQLPVSSSKREAKLQAKDASLLERKGLESSPAKISEEIELFTETETHSPINTLRKGKPRAIVQSDEDDALPDTNSLHRIISSKIQKRKPVISGDMDVPLKEGLGQRRAKLEMQKVPYRAADRDDSDEQENLALDEDEFYQEAKRLKVAKQAAKEKNSMKIILQEPIVEEVGKRHISYQMEKNKGLTPHRKKLTKNPRKKYKLKHQKAVIRRKGQVREIKRPSGSYGGEATGIRTTISRSVRFNS